MKTGKKIGFKMHDWKSQMSPKQQNIPFWLNSLSSIDFSIQIWPFFVYDKQFMTYQMSHMSTFEFLPKKPITNIL